MSDYDAVILGAGFAGAATAYHLSRSPGTRVLVLEKEPGFGVHASGQNACLLRQAVEDEASAALIQETLQALSEPPSDWPRREVFSSGGSLLLGELPRLQELHAILLRAGGHAELLRRGEFDLGSFPAWRELLEQADFEALLFSPGDGVIDVAAYLQNLIDAASNRGVQFRLGSEAVSVGRQNEGWRVLAGDKEFRARCLVNAAGAWADELASANGLGQRNLQPMRRHLFASKENSANLPSGSYLWDLRHECYFRARDEGLLLCAGDETPHAASKPETDPGVEATLFEKLRQYFPSLAKLELESAWACLRTFGPKGQWLDPTDPKEPSLFWAAGLGGHGVGLSFGLGRKVASTVHEFLVGRPGESL